MIQRPNGDAFEELPKDLEEAFREFWTDNADRLSLLYTGTGALKTDFTRFGKRMYSGAIEDGKRSVIRYVLNTFYDTHNQNALDLTLGKIKPQQFKYTSNTSPTQTVLTAVAVASAHPDASGPILLVYADAATVRQDVQLELLLSAAGAERVHVLQLHIDHCAEALERPDP